jgi:hypothetical protein
MLDLTSQIAVISAATKPLVMSGNFRGANETYSTIVAGCDVPIPDCVAVEASGVLLLTASSLGAPGPIAVGPGGTARINGSTVAWTTALIVPHAGDLDGDGDVDAADLGIVLAEWDAGDPAERDRRLSAVLAAYGGSGDEVVGWGAATLEGAGKAKARVSALHIVAGREIEEPTSCVLRVRLLISPRTEVVGEIFVSFSAT